MEEFSFPGRSDGLGNRLEEIIQLEYLCKIKKTRCEYIWNNIHKNRTYDILLKGKNVDIVTKASYPLIKSIEVNTESSLLYKKSATNIRSKFKIYFKEDILPTGIHIRASDRINNSTNHPHFMKNYKELAQYIICTIKKVNEKLPKYVFIASENDTLKNIVKNELHNSIIITEPICDEGIPSEYKDFFALTLCDEIWMCSRFSSFSILASLVGGIPINTFFCDKSTRKRYKANFINHNLIQI